jgi:hypothetical protein
MASAGSRPTAGGNERPDGVPSQNSGEKNACQQGWCRQLHETSPLLGRGMTTELHIALYRLRIFASPCE